MPPPPFKLMLQWCRLTDAAKFPAMGITSEDAPRRPTENSELMAPARMTGSWKLSLFPLLSIKRNISKHMQSRKWYLPLLLKDGSLLCAQHWRWDHLPCFLCQVVPSMPPGQNEIDIDVQLLHAQFQLKLLPRLKLKANKYNMLILSLVVQQTNQLLSQHQAMQ